ncbi:MAG: NYN domain-containing protein [Candidatus Kariarchaeaceae archaeon]|jgi:hypothetical protein
MLLIPVSLSSGQLGVDQNSAPFDLVLELDSDKIEYGSQLTITYGVLNNISTYLANISQLMVLVADDVELINTSQILATGTIVLNSTSIAGPEELKLNTLGTAQTSLLPGNYSLFYFTNNDSITNINTTRSFEVYPQEGSNLVVNYFYLPNGRQINEPVRISVGSTRSYEVQISNLGDGNAVNINFDLESLNGPHQYDSGVTPFQRDILGPLGQISLNFSITAPDYGIGVITFALTYNNTIGRTLQVASAIEFQSIPTITGFIETEDNIIVGLPVEFQVTINNPLELRFDLRFRLSSSIFSFSPAETPILLTPPGTQRYLFTGLAFSNGTTDIILSMTYLDPDGSDERQIEIGRFEYSVGVAPVDQIPNDGSTMIVILYILLVLIIASIFVVPPIRDYFVRTLLNRNFIPDLDFENKKVVVDGSNVAWETLDDNGRPSMSNIILSVNALREYGFRDIIVIVDAALRHQMHSKDEFDEAAKDGIIKVLPAKVDGDSFILRLARDNGALILTNDLYKEYRDEFRWIDKRRIPFSILNGILYLHPLYDIKS